MAMAARTEADQYAMESVLWLVIAIACLHFFFKKKLILCVQGGEMITLFDLIGQCYYGL